MTLKELQAELDEAQTQQRMLQARKQRRIDNRNKLQSNVDKLDREIELLIEGNITITTRIEDLKILIERVEHGDLMYEYKFTSDIWGYEPGIGKANTIHDATFLAADDAHAMKIAETHFNSYRWTDWEKDAKGWERNRTSNAFNASWMRIERITE